MSHITLAAVKSAPAGATFTATCWAQHYLGFESLHFKRTFKNRWIAYFRLRLAAICADWFWYGRSYGIYYALTVHPKEHMSLKPIQKAELSRFVESTSRELKSAQAKLQKVVESLTALKATASNP